MYFGEQSIITESYFNNRFNEFQMFLESITFLDEISGNDKKSFKDKFLSIVNNIFTTISNIFKKFIDFVKTIWNKFKEKIKRIIKAIKKQPQFINTNDDIEITDFEKVYNTLTLYSTDFLTKAIYDHGWVLDKSAEEVEVFLCRSYLNGNVKSADKNINNFNDYYNSIKNAYEKVRDNNSKYYKVVDFYNKFEELITTKGLENLSKELEKAESYTNQYREHLIQEITSTKEFTQDESDEIKGKIKILTAQSRLIKINIGLMSEIVRQNQQQMIAGINFLESHITTKVTKVTFGDKRKDDGIDPNSKNHLEKNTINQVYYGKYEDYQKPKNVE